MFDDKTITNSADSSDKTVSRRDVLAAAGLALFAGTGVVSAAEHEMHAHKGHGAGARKNKDLIASSLDCTKTGLACINHCLDAFVANDTSLAGCARTVQEMLVYCDALTQLGTYNSKHLKMLTKACMMACQDCEVECRKHEKTHMECKNCADACAHCIAECKKFLAA